MSAVIPSDSLSENGSRVYRPLVIEVDLCLYRTVSECCRGRILPFGVRQMIKDYVWVSFDNDTLRKTVRLWCRYREKVRKLYGDINDWDVSQVTNMSELFRDDTFNDPIDRWDVRRVTTMNRMFANALSFNQPLDSWDVHMVTNMSGMFSNARAFNQSLSTRDVRQVTTMNYMFRTARSFNQAIDTWDVGQVTTMRSMFEFATSFNQPFASWNVRQVCDKRDMFYCARSFNQSWSTWEVRGITYMRYMVDEASSFTESLDTWDAEHVQTAYGVDRNDFWLGHEKHINGVHETAVAPPAVVNMNRDTSIPPPTPRKRGVYCSILLVWCCGFWRYCNVTSDN